MWKNLKKRYKALAIFGGVLTFLTLFLGTINIVPPPKVLENNYFIKAKNSNRPMLAAHRGGAIMNPENTLKAYKAAVNEVGIDIVESDVWLTKDSHLVFSHDGNIDRMSDIALFDNTKDKHYICDYTLSELENFNFGYNFKDKEGNYPYKNLVTIDQSDRKEVLASNDLQILEFEKLLAQFYESNPDLMFIVEIKDDGERGKIAANIIDEVLTNKFPKYKNQFVVGTFHNEISKDLRNNHKDILCGASTGDAAKFILTELFGVNLFYNSKFACLQIPTFYNVKGVRINLDMEKIINRAHRRNIAVQYWTINDKETMKHLASIGADCIMTDDPSLFIEVFGEK